MHIVIFYYRCRAVGGAYNIKILGPGGGGAQSHGQPKIL